MRCPGWYLEVMIIWRVRPPDMDREWAAQLVSSEYKALFLLCPFSAFWNPCRRGEFIPLWVLSEIKAVPPGFQSDWKYSTWLNVRGMCPTCNPRCTWMDLCGYPLRLSFLIYGHLEISRPIISSIRAPNSLWPLSGWVPSPPSTLKNQGFTLIDHCNDLPGVSAHCKPDLIRIVVYFLHTYFCR